MIWAQTDFNLFIKKLIWDSIHRFQSRDWLEDCIEIHQLNCSTALVNNLYTKMYLKYIYSMLSILQIHLHIYVHLCNKNTLQLYFCYT